MDESQARDRIAQSEDVTLIDIRKLAAVDMVWLGTRIVLAEYGAGIVLPLILGLWSVRQGLAQSPGQTTWSELMGLGLIGIAMNYVPLFLYACAIAKAGRVEQEGRPELARASRYGLQQAIILVPLLVVVVALAQERHRRR